MYLNDNDHRLIARTWIKNPDHIIFNKVVKSNYIGFSVYMILKELDTEQSIKFLNFLFKNSSLDSSYELIYRLLFNSKNEQIPDWVIERFSESEYYSSRLARLFIGVKKTIPQILITSIGKSPFQSFHFMKHLEHEQIPVPKEIKQSSFQYRKSQLNNESFKLCYNKL